MTKRVWAALVAGGCFWMVVGCNTDVADEAGTSESALATPVDPIDDEISAPADWREGVGRANNHCGENSTRNVCSSNKCDITFKCPGELKTASKTIACSPDNPKCACAYTEDQVKDLKKQCKNLMVVEATESDVTEPPL